MDHASQCGTATVFVPATVGNVGPGFDVLGMAVEGLGDRISVTLVDGPPPPIEVRGVDAEEVPTDPAQNCATIAARAMLAALDVKRSVALRIDRRLPVAGGLGSSASASVGGALAASLAAGFSLDKEDVVGAALVGEVSVAGRHLDNIAPCLFGGITLVRSVDPPDIVSVPTATQFHIALVSPAIRIETRESRSLLPDALSRADWTRQMAQMGGLLVGLSSGDLDLIRRSLWDPFAEPRRKGLIPGFDRVKKAAMDAGALGCSISGGGPTVFAMCATADDAERVASAMEAAFSPLSAQRHVGPVSLEGARVVPGVGRAHG